MGKKRRDNTGMGVEEKYEEVRQLVSMGRERGFLALDEINELLPEDVSGSPEEIEEIFAVFYAHAIEIVDSDSKEHLKVSVNPDPGKNKNDISGALLEKTNDPVRMYLREMGTVPLLTRQGEVSIARRIERGERRVLNALARSEFVVRRTPA